LAHPIGYAFFLLNISITSQNSEFFVTKECEIEGQIMDYTALGKSFEIVSLCEKNNSNVHFCSTTESSLPLCCHW